MKYLDACMGITLKRLGNGVHKFFKAIICDSMLLEDIILDKDSNYRKRNEERLSKIFSINLLNIFIPDIVTKIKAIPFSKKDEIQPYFIPDFCNVLRTNLNIFRKIQKTFPDGFYLSIEFYFNNKFIGYLDLKEVLEFNGFTFDSCKSYEEYCSIVYSNYIFSYITNYEVDNDIKLNESSCDINNKYLLLRDFILNNKFTHYAISIEGIREYEGETLITEKNANYIIELETNKGKIKVYLLLY